MKTIPMNHLMQWCNKQNFSFEVANAMLDRANSDIEYWHDKDYWKLYDAIREEVLQ